MNCNSETEEETVAVNKKRARRVSFAENTSVHIFDRDEESESPTEPRTSSPDVNSTDLGLFNDELGFRRNSIDANDILRNNAAAADDDDDDEDDDEYDARPSFFRPLESPSSGSGFGSATSIEEENFFGPVSGSFIRPGRLSDSTPYDDNHEVTMDSTAFSMNFRSLAKSDSGGDVLSSTGVQLTFDEKTPTQNSIPINQGSTMVLTVAKKPNLQSSSPPLAKSRSNSDSNDMSLVGDFSRRYDYGGLSPGLDELLAQTSKGLHASGDISHTESLRNIKSGLSPTSNQGFAHNNVDGKEYTELVGETIHDKNSPTDIFVEQNISAIGRGTPSNLDIKHHELGGSELQVWNSPLISSINSLPSKRRQIVDNSVNISRSPWHVSPTPTHKEANYFAGSDDRVHKASISSIQKSISKLELLHASPFSVTLSAKIGGSNARFLDATVNNNESLSQHGSVQSCLAIVHSNHSEGSLVAEKIGDRNMDYPDIQGNFGAIKNYPTPLEHQASHIIQTRTPNKDSETGRGQTKARNDMAEEGGEVAFCSSNVSFSQNSANDLSIRKNLGKLFAQSPSGNELSYPISILGKLSPCINQVTSNIENSTRKRSNEGITLQDENTKSQKSPKLCIDWRDPDPLNGGLGEESTTGYEYKHWVEIQSKTSEVTKNLLSLPADQLSLQSIDALEDVLVGLLRKQKYKMLCADMQSQKKHDPLNNRQDTRVAEAKLLLHKLVQEKAKLQLMRVKRDISLKRIQKVRSRVQECEMLRSNHLMLQPQKALHIQADMLSQCLHDKQLQSAHDNVTALGKVLEISERRITKLTESFLMRCKIKGKPDSAEAVVLVNDYLTKRACCRNLRLDMQMWDIAHLENRNGHCNIFLNYLGFITQRLHVTIRPVSVLSISYEPNNMNIVKDLPGVDARTAFAFVFDAEPTRKYVSSRSFAEETQISSLLLGNMLDVVEELQSARFELRNLIQSTFCSESGESILQKLSPL
ncbi:uncharacterized protein LOC141711470 isoform X2 [Apium graveolens]|uniref:uncharacterized protein LOC141711470 isoform X2 n=1 Tax=Apium graveolens TaxID=4045 RepID=UPI003D7B5EE2